MSVSVSVSVGLVDGCWWVWGCMCVGRCGGGCVCVRVGVRVDV